MKKYLQVLKCAVLYQVPKYQKKLARLLAQDKLQNTLLDLQSRGIAIKTVYDIGARHANWAAEVKSALPDAVFYLFEANEKCTDALQKSGFKFFIAALSSERKVVDFYQNDSTGDSYYRENSSHYDTVMAVKKEVITLGQIVEENTINFPDLIKLDTQGSELDILRGGLGCLKTASLVYMELPILNYNLSAPKFGEYLDFMREYHFVPYDICELHYSNGVLIQTDILFIKMDKLSHVDPSFQTNLKFL